MAFHANEAFSTQPDSYMSMNVQDYVLKYKYGSYICTYNSMAFHPNEAFNTQPDSY
jgi:hypothetical protein